jgi:phosphonate transport system substrate-binding protein
VRAVASGLTRSGSVDGYVWEALALVEPRLTQATRVVSKSELLGFPPFCGRADRAAEVDARAFQSALLRMAGTEAGRDALDMLQLDGMVEGAPSLYDGIAARMDEAGLWP